MFKGSVRDNIAYGKPDATDESGCGGKKAAFAHQFYRASAAGLATILSETAGNISTGSETAFVHCRAIMTKPSILILGDGAE